MGTGSRRRSPSLPTLRLTLRQLQIFAGIARAGSTLAAARDIALSQSATSAALKELESLLEGPLFTRAGRKLVLNERGRAMLPQARLLLIAAQSIESEFGRAGRSAPQLRIAASTTIGNYVVPALVARYRREEPGARFSVDIGNTQHVVRAVEELDADLGFIEGPTARPRVAVLPWMTDELVVVCSPRHPLARAAGRGKATLAQLRDATWLLRELGSGTREVVDSVLLPRLHTLRTEADFSSAEAIKMAAAEGLGITCLSRYAVEDLLALGRLVALRTALPRLRRTLYLVHHEERRLSPPLERFIAFCRARYRKPG